MHRPSAQALWAFSEQRYKEHMHSFLRLQDEFGLNVNLLLLCLYLDERGYALCQQALASLCLALDDTETLLKPLRALRRKTKTLDSQAYACLKQAELALEARQQQDLIAAIPAVGGTQMAENNLLAYCQTLGLRMAPELRALLQAVYPKHF